MFSFQNIKLVVIAVCTLGLSIWLARFGAAKKQQGIEQEQLKQKKVQLVSKAKEATLNENITENHEEIDGLADDAVDDRLQQYYRNDDQL